MKTVSTLGTMVLFLCLLPAGRLFAANENCSVIGTRVLDFGSYDVFSPSPTDANGTLRIQCRQLQGATVTVSLDQGLYSGGTFFPRRMLSGASTMQYNVFSNGQGGTVWGDGSSGTATVSRTLNPTDTVQSFDLTMYGRIPAGQNLAPGTYADSVNLTITFPGANSPATDTISVTSSVVGSCAFTMSGSIDFGSLDPVAAPPVAGVVAQPRILCSSGLPYTITDDAGLHEVSPGNPPLRLQDTTVNTFYIPYSISYTAGGTGTGISQAMDISAAIAAGVYAGFPSYTYTDTITFTITW